jgi:hypothetical protein
MVTASRGGVLLGKLVNLQKLRSFDFGSKLREPALRSNLV